MEIERITLGDQEFRLFYLEVDGEEICVTDESLNDYIEDCIEKNLYYGKVRAIDEQIRYYVAQSVADTEDEKEIADEVRVIIDMMN